MREHILISDEEYNDISQWLNKEVDIETESLCEEQIIAMKNTFSFQRWRIEKAYREFRTAMKKTHLGDILISILERL